MIVYEGKFNNRVNIQDEKFKLIGSMMSFLFVCLAIIFIIFNKPYLMYIAVFGLVISLIWLIYFIPKQIHEKLKIYSKIKPFLKVDEDNGITHGDVVVSWDEIERIAVIGETDDVINGFSTNSSNHIGNKIIVLIDSDMYTDVSESDFYPMFKKYDEVCLMDIDLMYVSDSVDLIEKLFEITFANKTEILYTNSVKNAEKFLGKD